MVRDEHLGRLSGRPRRRPSAPLRKGGRSRQRTGPRPAQGPLRPAGAEGLRGCRHVHATGLCVTPRGRSQELARVHHGAELQSPVQRRRVRSHTLIPGLERTLGLGSHLPPCPHRGVAPHRAHHRLEAAAVLKPRGSQAPVHQAPVDGQGAPAPPQLQAGHARGLASARRAGPGVQVPSGGHLPVHVGAHRRCAPRASLLGHPGRPPPDGHSAAGCVHSAQQRHGPTGGRAGQDQRSHQSARRHACRRPLLLNAAGEGGCGLQVRRSREQHLACHPMVPKPRHGAPRQGCFHAHLQRFRPQHGVPHALHQRVHQRSHPALLELPHLQPAAPLHRAAPCRRCALPLASHQGVGVAALESKRAGATHQARAASRRRHGVLPGKLALRVPARRRLQAGVDVCAGALQVHHWKRSGLAQAVHQHQHPRHSCCGLRVAHAAFAGLQGQGGLAPPCPLGQDHLAHRPHLDGVAQSRAGAVQLHLGQALRGAPSLLQRSTDGTLLGRAVGRSQSARAPILVHTAPDHHQRQRRSRPRTARDRGAGAADAQGPAGLPSAVAVRQAVEGLAPAVCGQHPCLLEHHAGVWGEGQVGASHQSHVAVAQLQAGPRHVRPHQRGRAGCVNAHRRPLAVKDERQPPRGHAQRVARGRVGAHSVGVEAQKPPVVGAGDAHERPFAPAGRHLG